MKITNDEEFLEVARNFFRKSHGNEVDSWSYEKTATYLLNITDYMNTPTSTFVRNRGQEPCKVTIEMERRDNEGKTIFPLTIHKKGTLETISHEDFASSQEREDFVKSYVPTLGDDLIVSRGYAK